MNINFLSPVTIVGSHFVEFQFGMELIKQNLYQNCLLQLQLTIAINTF